MMYIQINPELEMPIYEQLTMQIMIGIIRQELQNGDVLPSVRSLAADLGVNMHTVNKSYHALEKRGSFKLFLNLVQSFEQTMGFQPKKSRAEFQIA